MLLFSDGSCSQITKITEYATVDKREVSYHSLLFVSYSYRGWNYDKGTGVVSWRHFLKLCTADFSLLFSKYKVKLRELCWVAFIKALGLTSRNNTLEVGLQNLSCRESRLFCNNDYKIKSRSKKNPYLDFLFHQLF